MGPKKPSFVKQAPENFQKDHCSWFYVLRNWYENGCKMVLRRKCLSTFWAHLLPHTQANDKSQHHILIWRASGHSIAKHSALIWYCDAFFTLRQSCNWWCDIIVLFMCVWLYVLCIYEYIDMYLTSLHSVVNWGVCPWSWIGSAFSLAIILLGLDFISLLEGTIKIKFFP